MEEDEEPRSAGWRSPFFKQTTAFHTPQPSMFSTKAGSGSQLERLQNHVARIIKGLSSPPEMGYRPYNPELLTFQKRQWAKFQLQSLDHKEWKEPSKLFESMVMLDFLLLLICKHFKVYTPQKCLEVHRDFKVCLVTSINLL